MDLFNAKIAIVTGGASGIGRAVCQELARRGAKVVLADINADLMEKTAAEISKTGGHVKTAPLDVRDAEAVKKLVADTVQEYGQLDYMFNNAGIGVLGEARDFSHEDWKNVIDVNLFGVVNGVAAAYPIMIKQASGHIVNTASLAGLIPTVGLISYAASKHGVVGLSHSLRCEGANLGVKVSVVCPGFIQTPIYHSKTVGMDRDKFLELAPKGMPPEKCAREILRGVERNKAVIVITALGKIFWPLYRLSPSLVLWLWQRNAEKIREFRINA
jgi:NAD(P)-dependent dehydrogenase (short-subunit alcohol dehydrogenase family)